MTGIKKIAITVCFCLMMTIIEVSASNVNNKSIHLGFMDPSGVDVVGYTVESSLTTKLYRFYTFGFPSIAAIGLSYYGDYHGTGLTSSLGVGIGSVLYGSIAYQFSLRKMHYVYIGAGLTTSIVYNGAFPVLAYKYRF